MSKDKHYIPLVDKKSKPVLKQITKEQSYQSRHNVSIEVINVATVRDGKTFTGDIIYDQRQKWIARYEGIEPIYREEVAIVSRHYKNDFLDFAYEQMKEEYKAKRKLIREYNKELYEWKKQERLSRYEADLSRCDKIKESCWLCWWNCCSGPIRMAPYRPASNQHFRRSPIAATIPGSATCLTE